MKLLEVLTALRDEIPTGAERTVCILSRSREDRERNGEIMEYPIFEVSVDHEDPEINLLTDEGSSSPRPGSGAMTVGSLLSRLQELEKECARAEPRQQENHFPSARGAYSICRPLHVPYTR